MSVDPGQDHPVPPSWATARVADTGDIQSGRQRSPKHLTGRFSTPYLRAANITPDGLDLSEILEMDFTDHEREMYSLEAGDIVLAEASGSPSHVGRPAIWNGEIDGCCFQNTVLRYRPRILQTDYAFLTFRHLVSSGAMARVARGVGIQHLSASRLSALVVAVPPWDEQRRIAQETERRDGELQKAEQALLRAARKCDAQLDAVLFSIDARVPRAAGQDDAMSWPSCTVREAGEASLGKMRQPSTHDGPRMRPYLRVANVLEDKINFDDLHQMQFGEDDSRYKLRAGDILLNEGQSPELVGRPAMFRGEHPELYFQKTLLRFRAGERVDPEFALLVFLSYLRAGRFRRESRASTNIAHLSLRRFGVMPFPVPSLDEQRALVAETRPVLDSIEARRATIERSLSRIPELRAQILAAATTGGLVRQDPAETDAHQLMRDAADEPVRSRPSGTTSPPKRPVRLRMEVETPDDLRKLLVDAGAPMGFPELLRAAGLDANETDDVERLYLLLRAAVPEAIGQHGDDLENAQFVAK